MTKKIQLFSFITFSFIGLLIILVKLLLLDKGLVMDDEAWFLLLMRDLPTGGDAPTQFNKHFNNIYNGNIFSIRLSFLFFEVICYSVFSLGDFTYFKNQLNSFELFNYQSKAKTTKKFTQECPQSYNFKSLGECEKGPFATYVKTFTSDYDNCI